MSEADEIEVVVDPEGVRTWKVWAVGIAGVLVVLATIGVVVLYRPGGAAVPPPPGEGGPELVSGVRQRVFPQDPPDPSAPDPRLGRWGWVDREAGLVHMPIDAAMELVAEGRP